MLDGDIVDREGWRYLRGNEGRQAGVLPHRQVEKGHRTMPRAQMSGKERLMAIEFHRALRFAFGIDTRRGCIQFP